MVSQTHSGAEIVRALGQAYRTVYDEWPPQPITPKTRIFADLHANDPDPVYALEWRREAARILGITETRLPAPIHGKDYTIRELVEIISDVERTA
jgi:hypothetical protein